MKLVMLVLTALAFFSLPAYAEFYRTTTTADMDRSLTRMRLQACLSVAEMRADAYRSLYEFCDSHHNCRNVTAGSLVQPVEETRGSKNQTESMKPLAHVPVWM